MPARQQEEQPRAERDQPIHPQLQVVIAERVMQLLGPPAVLHRIQVRKLWDDHYRVNVLVGPDSANAKVAHSYFLITDGDGNIIAANPQITKRYG